MTIEELRKDIKDCPDCPFQYEPFNLGKKELMWGEGKDIMIIGQSPAASSPKKEGSRFDSLLLELLGESGITRDQICFTNICKTTIPSQAFMSQEQKDHCYSHIADEIIAVRPRSIITLGSLAKEWAGNGFDEGLIGDFPIQEATGVIRYRVPIYSINHPGIINYAAWKRGAIIKQLKNATQWIKTNSIVG